MMLLKQGISSGRHGRLGSKVDLLGLVLGLRLSSQQAPNHRCAMMTIERQTSPWVAATHVVEVLRMKWLVRTMGLGAGVASAEGGGSGGEGADVRRDQRRRVKSARAQ